MSSEGQMTHAVLMTLKSSYLVLCPDYLNNLVEKHKVDT